MDLHIKKPANICTYGDCTTRASFNLPGKKKALYCKDHAPIGAIDIISKKCRYKDCTTRPSFNFPGEKIGIWCSKHKSPSMTNVIKDRKCRYKDCTTRPSFNFPGEKIGIWCNTHKKYGMNDVKNKKCRYKDCTTRPSFNFPGEKIALHCKEHAPIGAIDIISKRCLMDTCDIITSNDKYKGYCLVCFMNLFPNEKVSRNYKIKEQHVKDYIIEQFSNYNLNFDKIVGGCSRRRPDCFIDLLTHIIVIECDENQHNNYEEICENKRTMELFQDFANRPIVFIRFNPDSYTTKDNKKIQSSFKNHKKTGAPIIRNKKEWTGRLEVLREIISHWLITIPEKEISFEYLFYDK